jgi:hypothetical protein
MGLKSLHGKPKLTFFGGKSEKPANSQNQKVAANSRLKP